MPEMLRDYHARTLRQIQGKMDQLEVGDCCYVKVSYIDSRGGVSPYKYDIELIDTSHLVNRTIAQTRQILGMWDYLLLRRV